MLSPGDSCNILSDIVPGGEISNARARIRQLRNMDLLGRDVVGAVAELRRVIAAARARVIPSLLAAASGRQRRLRRRPLRVWKEDGMLNTAIGVARTVSALALAGVGLSACIHDDSTDQSDEPLVVSGFVASPLGSRYAGGGEDSLESVDGLVLSPLSVHVERVYAEDGRGVSSPPNDSAYIESVLRTSTGTYVVNYVIEGERTSVDFDMEELVSYDSLFGQTTHDNHAYGFQIYRDLGGDDDPAPRDYVATARFFTFERRPGVSPYDGTVYEMFGTYGLRTSPESLSPLGSASYEGNIFGNVWDVDDPNRNTGLDLLRGTLTLDANLDSGDIGGEVRNLRRFDYGAEDRAWEDLADTVSIEIGSGTIEQGRFAATWEGRDSGDAPVEDSVRGFTGNMLGAFYGPAGAEVGGVWRGHRDATDTTSEQLINGFFSGGRQPETGQ